MIMHLLFFFINIQGNDSQISDLFIVYQKKKLCVVLGFRDFTDCMARKSYKWDGILSEFQEPELELSR